MRGAPSLGGGLSAAEIRVAAGIGDAPVDCVFGGPPCQGFALFGQRALDDPRNGVVLEFVRLVRSLGARSFVFENAKRLTAGAHRSFPDEVVEAFGQAGYDLLLPWRVLDAADYGVPQHRERLILLGVRREDGRPDVPGGAWGPPGRGRL